AKMMDKVAVIRSVVGTVDDHASHVPLTGWSRQETQPAGGWPSFGSVVAKLLGPTDRSVPAFIGVAAKMEHLPYDDPGPGFLGAAHALFPAQGQGRRDLVLQGINLECLGDRRLLLASLDRFRRDVETSGMVQGMDAFSQQAFGVLTSRKLADAL